MLIKIGPTSYRWGKHYGTFPIKMGPRGYRNFREISNFPDFSADIDVNGRK
jgi:hypothetical protein